MRPVTHRELTLVIEYLHASTDVWHFVDDGSSADSLDDVDEEKLGRIGGELKHSSAKRTITQT